MPQQPTPNMNEWLPRWKHLENRTTSFVSRLGLFMYWFRGVQSNRAFQMAIPAVRCFSLCACSIQEYLLTKKMTSIGCACIQADGGTQEESPGVLHQRRGAQWIPRLYGTMCGAARDAHEASPPLGSSTRQHARPCPAPGPKPPRRRTSAHVPPRTTATSAGGPSSVPGSNALCTTA